jgi:predicted ATPase
MPLAVELATTWVDVLGVDGVTERASDRLVLLGRNRRTPPSRQRTLRATLDWSYDLLEEPERQLLEHLAVFAGAWTAEAAEAVGIGEEVADVLSSLALLVDRSLVLIEAISDRALRYRLLETVRQYALEKLEMRGATNAIVRVHAEYCLRVAEQAAPALASSVESSARTWVARLESMQDDLRQAMRWLIGQNLTGKALRLGVALGRYWLLQAQFGEARARLNQLLALGGDARLHAEVLTWAGITVAYQGDLLAARPLLEQTLAYWRGLGDRLRIAASLNELAQLLRVSGDRAAARILVQEALCLSQDGGHHRQQAQSLNVLGLLAVNEGDVPEALRWFEAAHKLAAKIDFPTGDGLVHRGPWPRKL